MWFSETKWYTNLGWVLTFSIIIHIHIHTSNHIRNMIYKQFHFFKQKSIHKTGKNPHHSHPNATRTHATKEKRNWQLLIKIPKRMTKENSRKFSLNVMWLRSLSLADHVDILFRIQLIPIQQWYSVSVRKEKEKVIPWDCRCRWEKWLHAKTHTHTNTHAQIMYHGDGKKSGRDFDLTLLIDCFKIQVHRCAFQLKRCKWEEIKR